ncbi:hypothetical protein P2318_34750 [Myxococcaceae bacterium GXIMD 01537]
MQNRFGVLLAGLCLSALVACGAPTTDEAQPAGEPAQQDPKTGAIYCPVCPVEPIPVQAMSSTTRTPVRDEVSGQYICLPCEGGGYCGDGYCGVGESSYNCPSDCGSTPYCGDGMCNGSETSYTCSADCGAPAPYCGDGTCNGSETSASCPQDCGGGGGYCGDGVCVYPETRVNCRVDCLIIACYVEPCPVEPIP